MVNNNQTYAVTVTNNGTSPANGVKLTDVLPVGVNFVSVTPSQGTCANTNGTIICDLGTSAKQQSATIEIIVKPTIVGKITHVVSVTGNDPDSTQANNQASLETTISSLPSIGGRVVVAPGQQPSALKRLAG